MIIDKNYYKRNIKTGDIIKRQKVWVKCDFCIKEWETLYEYIKYKKLKQHLCASCRAKHNAKGKAYRKRKKIKCDYCGNDFKRSLSLLKEHNFCSRICSDQNYLENKYGHLEETFDRYPNEVAYLFGVILGDGNFKKNEQKNTTRITVAFDVKWRNLINIFLKICRKLKIKYHIEPNIHSNCQFIGFVLPDNLLKKYNLNYVGNKYMAQPIINRCISNNINFVAGMINSDGSCFFIKNKYENICVSGITKSIIDSCCSCLENNGIDYKLYQYEGRIDKRNGNLNNQQYQLKILKKQNIEKLRTNLTYKIKEALND